MISFTVPGTPAPQGSVVRNRHRGVRDANPATRPWRAAVTAEAARAHKGDPLRGPVSVRAVFAFVRPRSHYRTGRNAHLLRDSAPIYMSTGPDLDKLCRAIGDALTGTVLADDRVIARWDAYKVWADRSYADVAVTPIGQLAVSEAA